MNRERIKRAVIEWLFEGVPPEDRKTEVIIGLSAFAVFVLVLAISLALSHTI